jgi:hypothetical protein
MVAWKSETLPNNWRRGLVVAIRMPMWLCGRRTGRSCRVTAEVARLVNGWPVDCLEIDQPALDVDRDQLDANLTAHIHAFEPADHSPFDRDGQESGPGAFLGRAGDSRGTVF